MKQKIKKTLQTIYKGIIFLIKKSFIGKLFIEEILKDSMKTIYTVKHNSVKLNFTAPNILNKFRVETFSTKEPETLEWIDSLDENSILWDIGANVGLYSCYAAKARKCRVFSFEPSVFNIELLSRNIYINKLYDNISIIPLPLTENVSISNMNMSSTDWGGALSTFGKDYTHDGKKLQKKFEFSVIGLSMDQCVSLLNIPKPDYIKMDVDGIEHLILKGGKDILKGVKSIILEINEDFEFQAREAPRLLRESGLTFKEKRHSEMFDAGEFQNTYNQIWVR